MADNGYSFRVENVDNLAAIKAEYNVPADLQSCHTAIVDGYIIEGHVPVEDMEKLLAEKPDITGLAVAGMPIGSPGMETEGVAAEPFDVIAFDDRGNTYIFASYGG
ncbi:MAG: DUF411 domain-containing protein [Anaerolineales bacterium]|nr:DUF411 domain-containing protein [Anaerolineales bacterium]